jgi:hypothetical protein
MDAREAVRIMVKYAQEAPQGDKLGEAARIVLSALKERDRIVVTCEPTVLIMTKKLEEAIGEPART